MRVGILLFLITEIAFAQVQNAAAGLFTSGSVAPGSQAFVSDFTSAAPPSIGGAVVSIRPVGSSTSIPTQVVSATENGITFFVPPDVPLGNAQLIYKQAGELTQWTTISIVPSDFALYREPVAMNVNATGATKPNGMANPAQPGQAVQVFGTGIGAMPQGPPQLTLGGVQQTILHTGNAAGNPGVVQIDFQISAATPDGCYVPLSVTWGGSTATSYLSKTSDGKSCHHPFGLPTSALSALDSGGSVQTGLMSITTALNAPSSERASRQESAMVVFSELQASQFANYFTAGPVYGCSAIPALLSAGFLNTVTSGSSFGSTMTLQSATTRLTLTNAQFSEYSATIPASADAPLNSLPAPVIGGGKWTWSVRSASFDFNIPPPIQINGSAPVSIQTGRDQMITWNGSGFDSGALLRLSLTAQDFGPPVVTCFAPAQPGSITIPGSLLSQFSAGGIGTLSVSVTEPGGGMPAAYLSQAGVLMLVSRGSTDTRPVDFK